MAILGMTAGELALEVASLHPAVRGARLAMMAVKAVRAARRARAAAQATPCLTCNGGKPPDCDTPRDKATKLRDELLNKRAPGLAENKHDQPYYQMLPHVGTPWKGRPAGKFRYDVSGHRQLFQKKQEELKQRLQELKDRNCGPPPPGAEEAANMDYPGKLAGPKGPLP